MDPTTMGFEQLLIELVKYGVFGVLFALLIFAYREKLKELNTLWQARIDDNNKITQVANTTNLAYGELARSMSTHSESFGKMAEATGASARALEKQTDVVEQIRRLAELNNLEMKRIADNNDRSRQDVDRAVDRLNEVVERFEQVLKTMQDDPVAAPRGRR